MKNRTLAPPVPLRKPEGTMPSLFFMTAPPPARKRKNGNLTVPVLLFPGVAALHIRYCAELRQLLPLYAALPPKRGFHPHARGAPAPHPPHFRPACLKNRCASNVRADRSGRLTAPELRPPPCKTCKTCKTCRPHKPAQTVRSKTRTHGAGRKSRVRPAAPHPPPDARRDGDATPPAATARATPARDRPRGCGRSTRR